MQFSGSSLLQRYSEFTFFSMELVSFYGGAIGKVDLFNDFFDSLNLDYSVIRGYTERSIFQRGTNLAWNSVSHNLCAIPTMLWPAWCSYAETLAFGGVTHAHLHLGGEVAVIRLLLQELPVEDPLAHEVRHRCGGSPMLFNFPVFGLHSEKAAIGVGESKTDSGRVVLNPVSLWKAYQLKGLKFPRETTDVADAGIV